MKEYQFWHLSDCRILYRRKILARRIHSLDVDLFIQKI